MFLFFFYFYFLFLLYEHKQRIVSRRVLSFRLILRKLMIIWAHKESGVEEGFWAQMEILNFKFPWCVLCESSTETQPHTFHTCTFAAKFWEQILCSFGWDVALPLDIKDLIPFLFTASIQQGKGVPMAPHHQDLFLEHMD